VTTIRLKGFLAIRDTIGGSGEVELEMSKPTIRRALVDLSRSRGDQLKDLIFDLHTSDVRSDTQILVNGRHYRHFPYGLDTELNDGDLVAIFPLVAGG